MKWSNASRILARLKTPFIPLTTPTKLFTASSPQSLTACPSHGVCNIFGRFSGVLLTSMASQNLVSKSDVVSSGHPWGTCSGYKLSRTCIAPSLYETHTKWNRCGNRKTVTARVWVLYRYGNMSLRIVPAKYVMTAEGMMYHSCADVVVDCRTSITWSIKYRESPGLGATY